MNTLSRLAIVSFGVWAIFTIRGCSQKDSSKGNAPPIINSISIFPQPVYTYTNLLCSAYDPDGDSLSYIWDVGGVDVTTGSSAEWESPGIPGYYKVNVTVDDGRGGRVTGTSYMSIASASP
ncbi:MAG: PKD domain-containing protein [Deltaproteobacteria bacterium]|nr:PKD domain-containing protein [Deltaproteobacteria bacterium]